MNQGTAHGECFSRLAADPDLRDIVDLFVEEMPERVAALQEQLQAADWDGLRRTAHQLKGAAGSYGFDAVSPYAGKVEAAVRDSEPEQAIREAVEELLGWCSHIRCGVPDG